MKCQEQVLFYSGGSRPSDGGGGVGGWGRSQKHLFLAFRASVRLEIRRKGVGGGGGGGTGPLPWILHCLMYS